MCSLVIVKNFIEEKTCLDLLTEELESQDIKYDLVSYSEVDDFYNRIHKKDYKNAYDILISFGGDGTILKSARIARKLDIPILGINAGNLGFLASVNEVTKESISKCLFDIKNKNYQYEERYMLDVSVIRNNEIVFDAYAVNEATITTLNLIMMGVYEVSVGGIDKVFNEYRADGLIISTPTGSTGHSLSAGGPIVAPDVNCFIITAICPHAFNQRSIVINDTQDVYVRNIKKNQLVDVDGRIQFELSVNDIVKISKLKKVVRYIVFEDNHFIKNIKCKIRNI